MTQRVTLRERFGLHRFGESALQEERVLDEGSQCVAGVPPVVAQARSPDRGIWRWFQGQRGLLRAQRDRPSQRARRA
ncbi:hypothetical protein DP117_27575 [Brasilonema sp. UFV-L1]|nr:hypothetical protein [Brasilonema sp. UFV-L1]